MYLGVIRAHGLQPDFHSDRFESKLGELLRRRAAGLSAEDDGIRRSARDMLRNGRYKPTGRGKPASEYLLRACRYPGSFPRINWPVDVCNYISLLSLLPVSIWDLQKATGNRFVFRLGREDEQYVFNSAGQVISVADLVVGCEVRVEAPDGRPIVNPVKDSMKTKTTEDTRSVAASVYAPADYPLSRLEEICTRFAELLQMGRSGAAVAVHRLAGPGEEISC